MYHTLSTYRECNIFYSKHNKCYNLSWLRSTGSYMYILVGAYISGHSFVKLQNMSTSLQTLSLERVIIYLVDIVSHTWDVYNVGSPMTVYYCTTCTG